MMGLMKLYVVSKEQPNVRNKANAGTSFQFGIKSPAEQSETALDESMLTVASFIDTVLSSEGVTRWRLFIHACIDSYNRRIYFKCSSNNKAETVFEAFIHGVQQLGLRERVHGDTGENIQVTPFVLKHPMRGTGISQYGINWNMRLTSDYKVEIVNVLDTVIPSITDICDVLHENMDPFACSKDYGIDLYLKAL
uniref:Integrase core domain-containing protein n=1 Tax=Amphimedon queenslandica TaxID=400682 RepID=A0A1X7TS00_AMPQE